LGGVGRVNPKRAAAVMAHGGRRLIKEPKRRFFDREVVMPTYEYACKACGHQFELMMTLGEHEKERKKHKVACPKCGSKEVVQRPSAAQVVTSRKD
jgi:putative FmdB family regulatory protein